MQENNSSRDDRNWFLATLVFIVIDYARPQDIFPIGALKPGAIALLVLTFFIITRGGLVRAKSDQTRMIWYFIFLTSIYIPFALNNRWAFLTTQEMLMYMPFIISTIICVNTIQRLKTMIVVMLGLMMYIAIYSVLHGGKGSGNYFTDENDLSLYINMWIPFCYFLFLYENKKKMKLYYATGLVIGLGSVAISFSRGGFVGLVCMMLVVWFVSPHKIKSMILISILGLSMYIYTGDSYKKEMSTVTDTDDGTAKERILSWEAGWRMFLDNPLGVGGNNFQYRFPEYQSEDFSRSMWGRAAHSLWFTLIPELGIFGVIIYIALLRYNIRDIWRLRNIKIEEATSADVKYLHSLAPAFMASLVGFFVSASFISVLYYAHYWYVTGIIVAATRIGLQQQEQANTKSAINPTKSFYLTPKE